MFIQQPFALLSGTAVTPVTLVNTENAANSTTGSTFTFSGIDLGVSGIKKIVVAAVSFNGAAYTLNSLTVDGSTATQLVTATSAHSTWDYRSAIHYVDNVTATSGDIVFSYDSLIGGVMIGVYTIVGGATGLAYDTDTDISASAITSQVINLDIAAGGCAIACAANAGSPMGASSVYGWTNLTEAFDTWDESPYTLGTAAGAGFTAAQSGLAITAAITGNTGINAGGNSMAGASWKPVPDTTGTATFTEVVSSSANQATYTFTGADIGTADASRVVVLYVGCWNDGGSALTITGVTVGGAAAAQQASYSGHASGGSKMEIWTCAVASGTSANIVVSTSSAGVVAQHCQVGIWDCKSISTTKTDSDGANNTSTTTETNTLSCPANGVIIVGGYSIVSTVSYTNVTEDYDSHSAEGINYYSGASEAFSSDQIDRVITMTAGSTTQLWMVSASFGPA